MSVNKIGSEHVISLPETIHHSIQHKAQYLAVAFKAFHILAVILLSSLINDQFCTPALFSSYSQPPLSHTFLPQPRPRGSSPAALLSGLPLTLGLLHMLFLLLKHRESILT